MLRPAGPVSTWSAIASDRVHSSPDFVCSVQFQIQQEIEWQLYCTTAFRLLVVRTLRTK